MEERFVKEKRQFPTPIETALMANGTGWNSVGGPMGTALGMLIGAELVDEMSKAGRVTDEP
ncbi:MAG: hypothetical protein K0R39_4515 [Symbiobacteriaceae bacterium]|nr:hypothetical protein [Symbiobacteriaceae bacterium]